LVKFLLTVDGGTGQYIYRRDVETIFGPTNQKTYVYELEYGADAAAVGTFFVQSGGQEAKKEFFVRHPDCSGF
jgi:hypothetical protein